MLSYDIYFKEDIQGTGKPVPLVTIRQQAGTSYKSSEKFTSSQLVQLCNPL